MNNMITNNIPQETVNSVLIDILKGAKDAGSEIYGASKTGIVKAVEFAQEQSPMVVQEFLMWKFAQSVIWVIVGVIALGVLSYLFKKCVDWFPESEGVSIIPGSFFVLMIVLVCCMIVVPNIEQMVKVKVAPRVFMIEWVSSQVTGKNLN
jgi:phosphotransferase system  glucose/maltose/N-acetylglucosamine-specific IIC component